MIVNKKIDASSIELWRYYRRQPYLYAKLPEAWQHSIEHNYVEAMQRVRQRQRRKAIPISIMATFAALTMAKAKSATTYTTTITGTSADTQYTPDTDASGNFLYILAINDAINVESANTSVYGVAITSTSASSTIDATAGGVTILATRDVPSSGTVVGGAYGVYVSTPSTAPKSVTINGPLSISAVDHNSYTTRIGGTVTGNAYALWADDFGSITINGNTTLKASTPGYGHAIYLTGNGSSITINGNLTAESDSNSTDYAIQGEGRSQLKITGNVDLTADGVYPSDNVNGIWNGSVSARTEIDGNLNLYAIAHGSTVMGIRNNGNIYVGGTTTITAIGNRSAFGVNAQNRASRTEFHGDATISSHGGVNTFGDTTGVNNNGGNGGGGYMRFDGNLDITAINGTFEGDSDVYGLSNSGVMSLTGTTTTIQATGTKGSHSAYGLTNSLSLNVASNVAITVSELSGATYGVVNSGTANFTGGLSIAKASGSTAASHYGVITRSSGSSIATTNINQGKSNDVTIQGDVLTGSKNGYAGTLNLNLDTSGSWLNGLVLADTDGSIGAANVSVSNGASWIVTGSGTVATNFGSGSLAIGTGGVIDMAASWGTFTPGSIPTHSLRTLQIDSTTGASVSLSDGAQFTLLSDIRNAQADKVVFGSGIKSFSAQGTQAVRIAYDPVLEDTSWVNASAIQNGVAFAASSPIVIVDASSAASGAASFRAVQGLTSQWSTTYENALVRFSYVPEVSLSSDHKQILLTGIDILGNGTSASGSTGSTGGSSSSGGTSGTTTGLTGGTAGSTGSSAATSTPTTTPSSGTTPSVDPITITPSTGVLVAGDAALALSNIWQIDERAVSRRSESLRTEGSSADSAVWVDTDGGDFNGNSSDGRTYKQTATNASVGAEKQAEFDGGHSAAGLVYTHTQSHASLQDGKADLRGDSIGAYGSWSANQGLFADVTARIGQLRNSYNSADAFGTTAARYRAHAASVSARAGRRFQGANGGYIEPQVQAAYGSIGSSSYTADNGVRFNVNSNHTFLTRAGVLVGKTFFLSPLTTGDMYARVGMVHTVGNRPDITASLDGGSLPVMLPRRHATTGEAAVGGHVALAGRLSVFAEAGRTSRNDVVAGGWRASAGVRLSL
jgi:outer membrane autotransporter protein